MKKFHYSYLICAATTLTFFCITGLACNAFSIYLPFILKAYGISNTQSSTILLTRSLFGFLSTAVSGWYYRTFSLRNGMMIAGLCTVLGFFIYALAPDYTLILCGSALTGIGFGLGATLPISMMLNRWFKKGRNIAMSFSTMGSTFAMIGIPSLITWGIEHRGLKPTLFVQGIVILVSVVLCFLIFRSEPSELGIAAYGADTDAPEASGGRKERTGSRIITRGDWIRLTLALLFLGAVANPGYNHLSVFLNAEGFRPETIAIAFSIGSAAASAGKFMFGWIADRFSTYYCNFIYGFLAVAGLAVLCVSRSSAGLIIGMTAFDIGVSIAMTGPAAWSGDLSEPAQYDSTIQHFQKMYTLGSLVFTLMPGVIADRCGGSYLPAYWIFTAFTVYLIAAVQRQYIKNRH